MATGGGIANSSLRQGWNTFTLDGTYDYSRWSNPNNVFVQDPGSGSLRNVQPDDVIPAGVPVYIYTSTAGQVTGTPTGGPGGGGSGSGGQVLTGTQVPLDAATIAHMAAQDKLSAEQLAQNASEGAANRANSYAEALLSYNAQIHAADQQYAVDVARLGLDQANFNYQQRLGNAQLQLQQVQSKLASQQFLLSQNQFNASQRQAKETARENIISMLNARTGPQDVVKYDYLLNQLNAPNPNASTTIDPFAGLNDLYQESNLSAPNVPDVGSIVQNYQPTPLPAPGAISGNLSAPAPPPAPGGGGGGTSGGGATTGAQPSAPSATGLTPPSSSPIPYGGNAPPQNNVGSGNNQGHIDPATGKWVPDSGSSWLGNFDYNTVQRLNTPEWASGVPVSALKSGWNYIANGTADNLDLTRLSPGITAWAPNGAGGAPTQQLSGSVAPGTPFFLRMAHGGDVGPSLMVPMGGLGGGYSPVAASAPAVVGDSPGGRMTDAEMAQALIGPDGRPYLHVMDHQQTMRTLGRSKRGSRGRGKSRRKSGTKRMAKGGTYGGYRMMATGGTIGYGNDNQTNNTGATDYGAGLENPTITVNRYDPNVYSNLPALQKLWGNQATPAFRGFGANLSNPSLGLNNVPSLINYQRYLRLAPSEQKIAQDVYSTGLQQNWDDMLNSARQAAPVGRSLAATRYGG